MKLLKADQDRFVFQLGKREQPLLLELLKLYPLIPETYQRHARKTPREEASHKLLAEALAEQRQANKHQLQAMLAGNSRFIAKDGHWEFTLSRAEFPWLLQVLNDVRVGSWLKLGSPDTQQERQIQVTAETAPYLWAMELSGHFEHAFLELLEDMPN